MKATAPVLDSTALESTEAGDDGPMTIGEALEASPLGPFLDLPVPVIPGFDALPALPALPANPLEALLRGEGLPGLPGVDQLLKPITDLTSGFGSGVLGALDPTMLLQQASGVIDAAMEIGMGGLKVLDEIWQSDAAQQAQTQGRLAQNSGQEVSTRGNEISTVTQDAATVVQIGNAKLAAIAQSFVASAVASAPVLLTPPGQLALLASATEHVGQALEVVAQTRAELSGHTTQMTALGEPVPVPAGPNMGMSPFAIASSVLENVGKPLISAVTDTVGSLVEATSAPSVTDPAMSSNPASDVSTRPSSTTSLPSQTSPANLGSGPASVPGTLDSALRQTNIPGVVAPGTIPTEQASTSSATQRPASTVSSAVGPGMGMVPPMTGVRSSDPEIARNTTSYVTPAVFGAELGSVTAPVLGSTDEPYTAD